MPDGRIQSVPYADTDGKKKFWENGLTNQTDVSFSTGGQRSTLYFSGQYAGVTGSTPGDEFNRASVRLNSTHKVTNNLDLTFNAGYTQNRSFFYPSVDVSFVPTDAFPALKNINGLDFLKLRAGWSKVGNVNLGAGSAFNFGAYRLQPTFGQGSGYPYAGAGGYTVGNHPRA